MPTALPVGALDVRPAHSSRSAGLRRPFSPSPASGPYKLPAAVLERLTAALTPFKNREAAFALAVMVARYWSAPNRLAGPGFALDRRALAGHAAHDALTEAKVRGAVATLEKVGFLAREIPPARARYQRTADGLHRRPIVWRFGPEFAPEFAKANARAQAARGARQADRRPQPTSSRPTGLHGAPVASAVVAQIGTPAVSACYLGEKPSGAVANGFSGVRTAEPTEPNPGLEAALARLGIGVFAPGIKSEGKQ